LVKGSDMQGTNPLVTAGLTILGGCFVYVFGQLMSKTFLDPLSDLRKSIIEVQLNLAIHGPTIHNPVGRTPDASAKAREALLKSASELRAKSQTIFSYDKVRWLFRLPSLQDIERAAELLSGLSTLVYGSESKSDALEEIVMRVKGIERRLGFKSLNGNE
jgi:hypothetical protein